MWGWHVYKQVNKSVTKATQTENPHNRAKCKHKAKSLWYLRSRAASAHCTCRPAPSAWWTCGRSSATSVEPLEVKKVRKDERSCVKTCVLYWLTTTVFVLLLNVLYLHSLQLFPQSQVAASHRCEICLWERRWTPPLLLQKNWKKSLTMICWSWLCGFNFLMNE